MSEEGHTTGEPKEPSGESGDEHEQWAREVSLGSQGKPTATFLSEASRLLAGSLDYERTLRVVAGLALPYLGAWCIVDVVEEEDGERVMRRLAIVHPDPEKEQIARQLERSWPTRSARPWSSGPASRKSFRTSPPRSSSRPPGANRTCGICVHSGSAPSWWFP